MKLRKLLSFLLSGSMLLSMAAVGPMNATALDGEHGTPHGGEARDLPGTIFFADFNDGDNGVAYYDTTPGNSAETGGVPSDYRKGTDVDVETMGPTSGNDLCYTADGEWLKYTVNIEPGRYRISADGAGTGNLSLTFELEDTVVGTLPMEPTGDWLTWKTNTLRSVTIPENLAGEGKILKIGITGKDINLDAFTFTKLSDEPIKVTGVTLDQTALALGVGQKTKLTHTITPEDAENPSVTWSSEDDQIASVDQNGFVTGVAPGNTTITVTTVDGNFTAQCAVTIQSDVVQRPYGGKNRTIPGKIEFEDFDEGGEGIAYHDVDGPIHQQHYRVEEDMDIGPNESGYELFWTDDGEWVEYTTDILEAGKYTLDLRAISYLDAPGKTQGTVHFYIDDKEIFSALLDPLCESWSDRRVYSWENIEIDPKFAGNDRVIKVLIEGGNCNLDWFQFTRDYSVEEMAAKITSVEAPVKDAASLTLPEVQNGMIISIKSSSNEQIIALNGEITPPSEDIDVELVFTVTETATGKTADTIPITVTVPAGTLASELAVMITSLENPMPDQRALKFPAVPEAFGIKVRSSSAPEIIDLDGSITPPSEETEVELILTVYNKANPANQADTVPLKVTVPAATVTSKPVTMAAYGERFRVPGSGGDTWDSTWGADGNLYLMLNDGTGFNGVNDNSKVIKLEGTPEDPSTLKGTDLNNGELGNSPSIGNSYSSGIYEVDGALYFIAVRSQQVPQAWQFYNGALLKSTDGGKTWLNTEGQVDALPLIDDSNATFKTKDMADFSFVKYGQGGEAPAGGVDRSDEYVYLVTPSACYGADYYMARISRQALKDWTTTFDLSQIEYYTGGDGMLDENWTNEDPEKNRASILHDDYGEARGYPRWSPANITYNPALGRYFMLAQNSDSWARPQVESTLYTFEAPHPWGSWTLVHEEHVQHKDQANLTWPYFVQKFQSEDGKKMWMTVCGEAGGNNLDYGVNEYVLQFKPVYLTTEPIQQYEAEDADLVGTQISNQTVEFAGEKYVNGFDSDGDKLTFTVDADRTGAYFIRFRYHTEQKTTLAYYANGVFQEEIKFGKSEQKYAEWAEYTVFSWLNKGENTLTFQLDGANAGDIDFDYLETALYSTKSGSLPGCEGEIPEDETAAGVAKSITSIPALEKDANKLTLPQVPDGFSISISDTSDLDVIALDGTVTLQKEDTQVSLIFTITNDYDPDDTATTRILTVTVPARSKTAAEVAAGITSVPAPEKDAQQFTLPQVPEGFSIAIKSSSNPDVIALDGTIIPPEQAADVELVFLITNLSNPGDTAETTTLKVTVPAKTQVPVSETFQVVFDSQGGTPEKIVLDNVEKNATVSLPSVPVRQGWIFDGWWTEKDGQGEQFTETTPVTGDITLYAKWVKDDSSQPGSEDPSSGTSNPAESTASDGSNTSSPTTGDNIPVALYPCLAGVVILAFAGILAGKRKKLWR